MLHEIDFLLKFCWLVPCFLHLRSEVTWSL